MSLRGRLERLEARPRRRCADCRDWPAFEVVHFDVGGQPVTERLEPAPPVPAQPPTCRRCGFQQHRIAVRYTEHWPASSPGGWGR